MSSLQTKHSSNLINNDGNTDEDYSNMHLSRLDFASSSSPAQDREHWDVSRVVSPPGKELGQSNVESLEGTGMSVVAENIDWSSESFPAPIPNLSFNWLQNMHLSTNDDSETLLFNTGFAPDPESQMNPQAMNHSEITHSHTHTPTNTCSSCYTLFRSITALQEHSKQAGHPSYECTCGTGFSRADSLSRHVRDFLPGTYPCTFCTRHVGNAAFKRKYHLTQHLKGYHKMGREMLRILLQDSEQDGAK